MGYRVKLCKNFREDNRGSSLYTVLLASFFVIALGSALLYMSYSALMIRNSSTVSEDEYHLASSEADRILHGIKIAVAVDFGQAYEEIFHIWIEEENNGVDDFDFNDRFYQKVREVLMGKFVSELWGDYDTLLPPYTESNINELHIGSMKYITTSDRNRYGFSDVEVKVNGRVVLVTDIVIATPTYDEIDGSWDMDEIVYFENWEKK